MSEQKSIVAARGGALSVDLINGPIMKNLLIFMIPILVSYLFQQLYNAADTAIVGHGFKGPFQAVFSALS